MASRKIVRGIVGEDGLAVLGKRLEDQAGLVDPEVPGADRVRAVPLDRLRFEHQPRELIPDDELDGLIADGEARPAAVLARLRDVAAGDPYYAEILADLGDLARSIESQGVLQPIQVALTRSGDLVVRDGHRRCLASLLAGQLSVPALRVEEASEVEAIARAFVVNLQRRDLTALEKGAALRRLLLCVGRQLAQEQGHDQALVTVEALLEAGGQDSTQVENPDETGDGPLAGYSTQVENDGASMPAPRAGRGSGLPYSFAGDVRQRVQAMTGLGKSMVYNYLRLNALAPQARAAARGLSEKRLRPILSTPPHRHAEILAIAAAHGLDDKALASLCQVYRRNDEDEIQRVLAGLRRGVPGKGRTAVSWEPLVSALPLDVDRRLTAMDAELAALPPRQRDKRLAQVRQQIPLLRQVLVHFEDYDRRYSIRDE